MQRVQVGCTCMPENPGQLTCAGKGPINVTWKSNALSLPVYWLCANGAAPLICEECVLCHSSFFHTPTQLFVTASLELPVPAGRVLALAIEMLHTTFSVTFVCAALPWCAL
eukprot:scaffold12193_cov20-Tisochrysis_lutea.AAC.2